MGSHVHYLPLTPGFFSILVVLLAGLIILVQLRILRYAYMRLGVGPGLALLLLFGSLIGSYFNIPIAILPGRRSERGRSSSSSACVTPCRSLCHGPARFSR
jgi:uncharacterized membrane protein